MNDELRRTFETSTVMGLIEVQCLDGLRKIKIDIN
jgi:hypothetical protein